MTYYVVWRRGGEIQGRNAPDHGASEVDALWLLLDVAIYYQQTRRSVSVVREARCVEIFTDDGVPPLVGTVEEMPD